MLRRFLATSAIQLQTGAITRKMPASKARKAILTLTPSAVTQLQTLAREAGQPTYLRIGTKKKGCSGQVYTLEYVPKRDRLDEEIVQDGVTVLVDSKALFSIIGSEMDFVQEQLSNQFVFNNPNIKESCGCGQSFMT